MIVRELLTRLGFKEEPEGAKRYERTLQSVKVAAAATAAAVSAIGVAAASATRLTADAGREIARMSRIANAGTEEFQRMAVAAQTVGIENDKLSDILKDMNDRVGDFIQTGGGPMADFFENIAPKVGVTAAQFRNLSGPQALQLFVDSLDKANLSQADMVFYMEAIASDSTALLPILRNGAAGLDEIADAAQRYGAILSDEAIKQGEAFHRNLSRVRLIARGVQYTVGEKLLPVITQTVADFENWYAVNNEIIRQNIGRAINAVIQVMGELRAMAGRFYQAGRQVFDLLVALAGNFETLGDGRIAAAAAGLFLLSRRIGGLGRALRVGAIFLILDDIAAWMAGQPSLIASLLGPYDDFIAKLSELADMVAAFWQKLGVPEDTADGLSKLTIALGALVGYRAAVALFGTALSGMGAGLKSLAGGLITLGGTGAAKGLGVLRGVAAIGAGAAASSVLGGGALVSDENAYRPEGARGLIDLFNPSFARPPAAAGGGGVTSTINSNVTVNLPAGAPATQKDFVQQEVVPMIERTLDEATRRAIANYAQGE